MNHPPSLQALELAVALARRASDEELVDPGGVLVAQLDRCAGCGGSGECLACGASGHRCPDCDGTGLVRVA